jgi:hypothetical protein
VSRSLQEVTNVLNHPAIFNEWVKFPNSFDELNALRLEYGFRIRVFPLLLKMQSF